MTTKGFTRTLTSLFLSLIMLLSMTTTAFANSSENEDFNANYETLKLIEGKEEWEFFFRSYETGFINYSQWYTDYVDGGTVEEFESFSTFEQFIWVETYLRFAYNVTTDKDKYMETKEIFEQKTMGTVINLMSESFPHYEEVKNAYSEIAYMQYDNITETSYPYNYLNNKSFEEESNVVTSETEVTTNDEPLITDEEMDELFTEEEQEDIKEALGVEEEPSNNFTIIIIGALALVVVVSVVIFAKKKK